MDKVEKLSEILYELNCLQANIKTELQHYLRTARAASMRTHSLNRKLTHVTAQVETIKKEIEHAQQK